MESGHADKTWTSRWMYESVSSRRLWDHSSLPNTQIESTRREGWGQWMYDFSSWLISLEQDAIVQCSPSRSSGKKKALRVEIPSDYTELNPELYSPSPRSQASPWSNFKGEILSQCTSQSALQISFTLSRGLFNFCTREQIHRSQSQVELQSLNVAVAAMGGFHNVNVTFEITDIMVKATLEETDECGLLLHRTHHDSGMKTCEYTLSFN